MLNYYLAQTMLKSAVRQYKTSQKSITFVQQIFDHRYKIYREKN